MADIAQLGFKADTSDLADAKVKLEAIDPAAAKAEKAADGVGRAFDRTGREAQQAAAEMAKISPAAAAAASGLMRVNTAVNDNAGAMRHNVGNIAAQFQDIGVTAAMGMSPMMIALQQGTQLAGVFAASGGNAFKTLGGAILSVISPTALLTIGMVALLAAGFQMVDWANVAQTVLNGVADALVTIAPVAAIAGATLAVAFAPQILATVGSMVVAIGTGLVGAITSATSAMIAFSLANPFAALVIAIGATVAAAWAFNDDISQILGINVLQTAKKAANFILNSFRQVFYDIGFLWRNFPALIGAAATGATNAVIRSINWLITQGTAGINKLIDGANWALSKLGIGPIGHVEGRQISQFANSAADGLAGAFAQRRSDLMKIGQDDVVGAIGEGIDAGASWLQGKMRNLASSIGAGDGKKKKSKADKAAKGKTNNDWQGIVTNLDDYYRPIVANPVMDFPHKQVELITERMRTVVDVMNENIARGVDFAKSATRGFIDDLRTGIEQGKSLWASFGNAVMGVLNKIIDKMLDASIDQLFSGAGSGGGFLGSVFGSLGSLLGGSSIGGVSAASQSALDGYQYSTFAKGGAFANSVVNGATAFAFGKGGANLGIMGEAGPEAVMPLTRGPDGSLGVQMYGRGGGAAGSNVIELRVTAEEGDMFKPRVETIAEGQAIKVTQAGLTQFNEQLPDRFQQIAKDERAR